MYHETWWDIPEKPVVTYCIVNALKGTSIIEMGNKYRYLKGTSLIAGLLSSCDSETEICRVEYAADVFVFMAMTSETMT